MISEFFFAWTFLIFWRAIFASIFFFNEVHDNFFFNFTVYKSNANEHVFRKLMDELQTTMTIYRVWGSHLGSSQLFKQHLESRRRITEFVEKMQVCTMDNFKIVVTKKLIYIYIWNKEITVHWFHEKNGEEIWIVLTTRWHTHRFHYRNHNSHTDGDSKFTKKKWCDNLN